MFMYLFPGGPAGKTTGQHIRTDPFPNNDIMYDYSLYINFRPKNNETPQRLGKYSNIKAAFCEMKASKK